MNNLFHYEQERSPSYHCAQELLSHGLVKGYERERVHEALDRYFRSRLVLHTNPKGRPKPAPQWRLTIPLWALAFVLMAFVVLPLRWLFVGQYTLSHKSRAFAWVKAWHQKIFPWPRS